jgi:hypothetical protein
MKDRNIIHLLLLGDVKVGGKLEEGLELALIFRASFKRATAPPD